MLCRSETVITFHNTAKSVATADKNQTMYHDEDRPITNSMTGPVPSVNHNEGPLPIFLEIFGATNPQIGRAHV